MRSGWCRRTAACVTDAPLVAIAAELEIDEIVVAMDDRRQQFPLKELLDCRLAGIEVIELVTFLERETGKVHLDILNPSWMIFGDGFRRDVHAPLLGARLRRARRASCCWCSRCRSCC